MKRFALGLCALVLAAVSGLNASAGFSPFDPTGSAGSQFDSNVTISNFAFTGQRAGDSVAVSLDVDTAGIKGYTVQYTFTGGTTAASTTTMSFNAASNSPWKFKDFSVEGNRSGTFATYSVSGTATGATGTSSADQNNAANNVTFGSGVASSDFALTFVYNGSLGGSIRTFNVYFQLEQQAVPEPTSMAVFGLGALGFAARRYRRR